MSLKDREQKESALQFCLARGWLPHAEVDVYPTRQVSKRVSAQTDIDVLALIPDPLGGFRRHVFDCKTKAKESPINRVLWLHGLMKQLKVDSGTCILRKDSIEIDHRLTAFDLGVSLISESELPDWTKGLGGTIQPHKPFSPVESFTNWEALFSSDHRNPALTVSVDFVASGFWQIQDEAEAARKCIFLLRSVRGEIDPAKPEQLALTIYLAALFSIAVASLSHRLFSIFVLPKDQQVFEEALRVSLYGGRDAYEQRNAIYKLLIKARGHEDTEELGVPGWDFFCKLVRQMMESPIEACYSSHVLQELAFSILAGSTLTASPRAQQIASTHRRSAQHALNLCGYLFKATVLPKEIGDFSDAELLKLITAAATGK